MSNKLSELRDLKEMYEIRLKSNNVDKSLKDHYQTMLDTINEKIEKNQIFRRYFNGRLEKTEICPSCDKEMSSHDKDQALQCMRNFVENQQLLGMKMALLVATATATSTDVNLDQANFDQILYSVNKRLIINLVICPPACSVFHPSRNFV